MADFLSELHIGVLCPLDKPNLEGTLNEDEAFYERLSRLKREGRFAELHDAMKPIVAEDYRMVDVADFIILYIDPTIHMCGSYAEATQAAYQRKPVLICCEHGIEKIPNWLFGICKHEMFFSSWTDLKAYIHYVCFAQEVETYNRWRFFDFNKVYRNESFVGS